MEALSYTQEYYLCAINEKGKPSFSKSSEILVCLLVGCLLELQDKGYIEQEKKKYHAVQAWDDKYPYLWPVYEYVSHAKRGKALESFTDQFSGGKRASALLQAVGLSLAEMGYAREVPEQGLLHSKSRYAPIQEYTNQVVERIREELLGSEPINDTTAILTAFLSKSGILRNYFSREEVKEMKDKLDQIKKDDAYRAAKKALDHLDSIMVVIMLNTAR